MKKLFLLIPALVLSLAINATVQTISPSSEESDSNIRSALSGTADTIILNTGNYKEADQIHFKRNAVIMAAEGAEVTITPKYYCDFILGAKVKIIGIKFDGSVSNQQAIRVYDASAGKELRLENCEFYNFAKDVISGDKAEYTTDSCIVNNCYFHNNNYSTIYFNKSSVEGKQTIYGLKVTNSTFANNDPSKEYRALIDVQSYNYSATDDIEVIVDHCTFYNNTVMNYDYSAIRTRIVNRTTVSNCIFAHPSAQDWYATNVWAGSVTNCLAYNFNNGYNAPTKTEANIGDPLFTDAANGDFSFAGNWVSMNLSPARGAATDGSDLGDPRWYSAETLPSTDFITPYGLIGTKALLNGDIELNASNYIKYKGTSTPGTAKWKLHIEKACAISAVVDIESGNTSGRQLTLTVNDADGNEVGALAQAAATYNDDDINLGCLYIPEEGDYTLILTNSTANSGAVLERITLSYIGGAVQNMPGTTSINEAWFVGGTRADGKITFNSGHVSEGWVKWNVAFASAANYSVILNVYSNNGKKFTVALQDADGNNVVTPLYKNGGAEHETDPVVLEMGAMSVPAGNYILKVTNAEDWSDAQIISVQFVSAGGGLVDIPGDIDFNEVILSSLAYVDESGNIRFTNDDKAGHVTEESAKWRINATKSGYYKFTTSVYSDNGHSYLVSIYNPDETILKGSVEQSGADIYGIAKTFSSDNIYLEEGEYLLKVQNTTSNSRGRIVNITTTYEGGSLVNLPTAAIPFEDAILNGATRDGDGIHFGMADRYAEWNVAASAGLYTFTFNIVGSDYGIYQLTITDSESNTIYDDFKPLSNSGSVTHYSIYLDGNYTLKVANTNDYSQGYITSIVATAEEDVFILDDKAIDAAYINAMNGQKKKIVLNRTFKGGMYNTICLPFTDWMSSVKSIFGGDEVELLELSSAELDGNTLNLNFTTPSELGHGRPYLIKPTHDVANPMWTNDGGRTINSATGYNTQSCTNADFIGSFIKSEVPAGENNLFLGPNDLLYFSQTATPIKGTRAYFQLKGISHPQQAIKHARIVKGTQVITEIDLVKDVKNASIKTIENGQLVIIRDGIRYNAMGIRLQ